MMRVRFARYSVASTLLLAACGVLVSCVSGELDNSSLDPGGGNAPGNAGTGNPAQAGASQMSGSAGNTSTGTAGAQGQGSTTGAAGTGNTQAGAPGGGAFTGGSGSTGAGGTSSAAGATSMGGTTSKGGATGGAGAAGKAGANGAAGAMGAAGAASSGTPLTPISGGSTGFATRYWDCCKPACAWPGNQSMQSCNQDGTSTQGKGNNNSNACGGGNAFMCYNYEPWVDSSNGDIAYGFAAASGSNYVCGRCFEVQFPGTGHDGLNTPGLVPKTMYLQVINNGGVADNQFDILIPGGGVGAENACSTQWGSSTDLGTQYGGLYAECNDDPECTQNKCATAFAGKPDLLAGCSWFLNWYTGADNPNIVFKQVSCPSQLSSKSGMSG
jgi:Glycosyl hydrolase family 45